MGSEWFRSAQAARAIGYLTDPRPAWLWSSDGSRLLWCNPAARLFRARIKKHKLKTAAPAEPIKGQVSRLMRLGTPGRASLSRIQFTAGGKPVSATCTATPLVLVNERRALLIVGVDPVEKDLMTMFGMSPDIVTSLFDDGTEFVVANHKDKIIGGTPRRMSPDDADVLTAREGEEILKFPAGPGPATVYLFVAAEAQPEPDNLLSSGGEQGEGDAGHGDTEATPARKRNLTSLFDELSQDEALFTPLGPEDDTFVSGPLPESEGKDVSDWQDDTDAGPGSDDTAEAEVTGQEDDALWRITGRGFLPGAAFDDLDTNLASQPAPAATGGSRYNFEQLSRILTDRISGDMRDRTDDAHLQVNRSSALVNLSDETLVLNRLPLGLLVFKDQQILFANRAMTELIKYPDTGSLREAGLGAVFPLAGNDGEPVGAVTHLVARDGTHVDVTARLQSVSWQGHSAFMLTARAEETRPGTEAAVRAFTETLASLEGNGFFETSRAGIVDAVSGRAAELFGRTPEVLMGRPLLMLVGHAEAARLREFLDTPARFAETARPSILLRGLDRDLEILLFAEGQAGIVTGYFGVVQKRSASAQPADTVDPTGTDSALLGRLTRDVRRPLNTIIGFSELIKTNAFGEIQNSRYLEYARDIKSAGQDIAGIIDEIEEYARLNDKDYRIAPADFDLGALLQKCLIRVRHQASEARVLVRSAIPENLPQIKADEASLGQAILNLLASAIEQTPQGGQVVVSAHEEENGDIAIHLRDSGVFEGDPADRFVVFRDGTDDDGALRRPVASSVGLALTRSLLAVNTCSLSIDPTAGLGTLFSLVIPAALIARHNETDN